MKKKKGFALLDITTRKRIAAMGGKRVHALGKAHEWTSEEARKAGAKGGKKRKEQYHVS